MTRFVADIDVAGRVVIPKPLRKLNSINVGDTLVLEIISVSRGDKRDNGTA